MTCSTPILRFALIGLGGLIALSSSAAFGQDSAEEKITVKSISIKLEIKGAFQPWEGRISKRGLSTAKGIVVAEVDKKGSAMPSFQCLKSDKLFAEAAHPLAIAVTTTRPCQDKLEFEFSMARLAADTMRKFEDASNLAENGEFAKAQFIFSDLHYSTAKESDWAAAKLLGEKAVTNAAKALGDKNLDKYVIRDPSQNYKLVFSEEGHNVLRKIQGDADLPKSGMLDYKTQVLIKDVYSGRK